LTELADMRRAADERAAAVPKEAAGYELKLPDGVPLPDGFGFDEKNPLLAPLREMALKEGWTQETFSKLLAADLATKQAQAQQVQEGIREYVKSLGDNGQERVDNALRFSKTLSDDATVVEYFQNMGLSKAGLDLIEKIQSALTSQGVDALARGGPGGPGNGGVPANWDKLTFEQKRAWQYANHPPQARTAGR
jgi:hypothetical protein